MRRGRTHSSSSPGHSCCSSTDCEWMSARLSPSGSATVGTETFLGWRLAPVPSVTATAKALVTPVGDSVAGRGKVDAFLPLELSSGKPATLDVLRKAMLARGIQVLDRSSVLPPEKPTAIGYAECGNIDSDGHVMGLRLAGQLQTEVGPHLRTMPSGAEGRRLAMRTRRYRPRLALDAGRLRTDQAARLDRDRQRLPRGNTQGGSGGRTRIPALALG